MDGWSWISWVRRLSAGTVLSVGAAVAAAAYTTLTILEAPLWSRLLATTVVAGVGVAVALEKLRTDRRAKKEAQEEKRQEKAAAEAKWLQTVQDCLLWPAPRIRDVDPFKQLGVARSQLAERYTADGEGVPPYVDRDIDPVARKRLQSDGSVLLLGTPASGVTRTAYQLALTVPTSPLVFVPQTPHGLTTALGDLDVLSRLAPGTPLLLWLDRVDTFTQGGLTAAMLRRCRERSPGLRVVATISSIRYDVWATESPSVVEAFGDPVLLERLPSEKELGRAAAAYPGVVDFSEGIAAAFTVAASLLKRLRGGDHRCPYEAAGDDCALARVVVEIVLEWAATDIRHPLPADRLAALTQQRLAGRLRIEPTHLAGTLKWAASPVVSGASLLFLATDCQGEQAVAAHAGIMEIRRAEGKRPSEAVWTAALEAAGIANASEAVGRIGLRAHTDGDLSTAARAWALVTAIDDPAAQWLRQAAAFSRGHHDPSGEIPPLTRLLELSEAAYGPDHPEVTITLTHLGAAWNQLGRPAKARELLERALHINEREFGPDHPRVAATLTRLGAAWSQLGQSAKACELLERALHINEREFGPDHREVAFTLTRLGAGWTDLGQPAKARDLIERALEIHEREFGPDHFQVALTLDNLGNAWRQLGQPAKACELLERALHINERQFGPDHPEVAFTLDDLGAAWDDLGQPAKARELYERALHINERQFGPDHFHIALTLTNLGNACRLLGQPAKARELLERALHINERQFGPDHPEVALTLTNLGAVWGDLGQPAKALEPLERALHINEREFGPDHPQIVVTLADLGSTWRELGQPAKAAELYERALRILHAHFPGGHPMIGTLTRLIRAADVDVIILDDGRVIGRTQRRDNTEPSTGAQ
jgi:tetratricopeptide (TPR) repeat protein